MTKRRKPPGRVFKTEGEPDIVKHAEDVEFGLLIQAVEEIKIDIPEVRIDGEARLHEAARRMVRSKMIDASRIVSAMRVSDMAVEDTTKRARRYAQILRDAGFEFPSVRRSLPPWREAALRILQAKGQLVKDSWLRNHAALLREQFNDLVKPSNP